MFKIQWPVKKIEPEINPEDFVYLTWSMAQNTNPISIDEIAKILGRKTTLIDGIPCFNKVIINEIVEDLSLAKHCFRKELGVEKLQFHTFVDNTWKKTYVFRF